MKVYRVRHNNLSDTDSTKNLILYQIFQMQSHPIQYHLIIQNTTSFNALL